MSVRSLIFPFLAVLWLWPITAYGQSPEFRDAYQRYAELYAQGRCQEALPFAEKALRLGEREFGFDHPYMATSLNNLAGLYYALDRRSSVRRRAKTMLDWHELWCPMTEVNGNTRTRLEAAGA